MDMYLSLTDGLLLCMIRSGGHQEDQVNASYSVDEFEFDPTENLDAIFPLPLHVHVHLQLCSSWLDLLSRGSTVQRRKGGHLKTSS